MIITPSMRRHAQVVTSPVYVAASGATREEKVLAGRGYTCTGTAAAGDDSVMSQAALDAAAADRNGTIEFSKGAFYTAAAVSATATHYGVRLVGQGPQSTYIRRKTDGTHTILDWGSAAAFMYHTEIANLNISGDTDGDKTGVGLKIVKCDSVTLRNVFFQFHQDAVWVTTGTQYMLWDWVIIQNFSQYGIKFDQVAENPGHYQFNSVQVSIPDTTENCKCIFFAPWTSKCFEPIEWNRLSLWCPSDSVTGSYGVYLSSGAGQKSCVDAMTFNNPLFEGMDIGIYYGDTACRGIVMNNPLFEGLDCMSKGVVGSNYVGDLYLNNPVFNQNTNPSGTAAIDSTLMGYVAIDEPSFWGWTANTAGERYAVRTKYKESHAWSVSHKTADAAITVAEDGRTYTNKGDDGTQTLTLPASAPTGCTFHFVVCAAFEMRIKISAASKAFYALGAITTDDGGADLYLMADDEGESLTLVADGSGNWIASQMYGTWTVTQP